jgi:geranylgeranyl diphosphate synthase type I
MDGDLVRRGGPSVHAALRSRFGSERQGDVAAILAGDWACGVAQEALLSVDLPPSLLVEAARVLARTQSEVVLGQILDVRKSPETGAEAIAEWKTASYTVRGPLGIGAALGGADSALRAAFDRFARPLGIAFQLRDDVLGAFGDARATGKPVGADLRRGARTALVAEVAKGEEGRHLLSRVFDVAEAPDADVELLLEYMERSGARTRVEARISALLGEARFELASMPLPTVAREVLEGAVLALGERES